MHEASLAKTLIRQVEAIATEQSSANVLEVSVSIGEFSGVEPDLLRIAFERQILETPLCGVRLNMVQVPLEGLCTKCKIEFPIKAFRFVCPRCGESDVDILRGEEMIFEGVLFEELPSAELTQPPEATHYERPEKTGILSSTKNSLI